MDPALDDGLNGSKSIFASSLSCPGAATATKFLMRQFFLRFAGALVAVAPVLLLFHLFQRNIVRGLTASAIK